MTVSWDAVDHLIDRLDVDVVCDQRLGPLAARRRRALGLDVPERLLREERAAMTANLVAPTLLARARGAYDGPLLVIKGPEVSRHYPGRARRFGDLDLLPADADAAQSALLAAGFQLQERDWPPEGYDDVRNPHYHLQPLEWPGLALRIEVHKNVKWPTGMTPPSNEELFEAAVPAALGVDGLLTPHPHHHAVLLSSHAWGEIPMRNLRELIDVMVFVADEDRGELQRIADGWAFGRAWRTTIDFADWMLAGQRRPTAARLWARYVQGSREPTVVEMHVQEWLSPFWMAPPAVALRRAGVAVVKDFRPEPHQTWPEKLKQMRRAVLHPFSSKSDHDRRSGHGRWKSGHP